MKTISSPLARDICMFCSTPVRGDGACECYKFDGCPNCGFLTCRCTPAPCCGAPWSPMDWEHRTDCYICGAPRG